VRRRLGAGGTEHDREEVRAPLAARVYSREGQAELKRKRSALYRHYAKGARVRFPREYRTYCPLREVYRREREGKPTSRLIAAEGETGVIFWQGWDGKARSIAGGKPFRVGLKMDSDGRTLFVNEGFIEREDGRTFDQTLETVR
jgi:hypothetical protein